jgi:hypothetical protein
MSCNRVDLPVSFAEPTVSVYLPARHWSWVALARPGKRGLPAPDDSPVELGVDLIDRNTVVGVLRCPAGIRPEEFDVIRGGEREWTLLRISQPLSCDAHVLYEITASL